MTSKLLGGILLVIGTTIGAGMLALPVATAELGFWGSFGLLTISWLLMTACAFLFLEINLWLPKNTNLISMAGATLGPVAQAVAWFFYLLLLYSLISAYIAGGGDLFHYLLKVQGITISLALASFIFTMVFAMVVFMGIRSVDYVNRGLMTGKLGAFILLVILIAPYISSDKLILGEFSRITSLTSVTVTAVAFGSLMIIPSLRTYFEHDIKSLRKAIFLGMFIPYICYVVWDLVIMGVIPYEGDLSLTNILHSPTSNSDLVQALGIILQQNLVTDLAKFFTSICMTTSFLSISLSLSDFLSDGFKVSKEGKGKFLIFLATFIPPLVVVVFYPDAFIRSLDYAGICVFILMVLMPPMMVWRGRYHLFKDKQVQIGGGKWLLGLIFTIGVFLVGLSIYIIAQKFFGI